MKKKLVLILSLIAILTVSACTAAGTSAGNTTQTAANNGISQLPTLSRLVVGTYKLIDSATPVTQDQAKEFVVLWKAYKELETRDSKAQQEVTDLLTQINSLLTSEQIAAIDAMNLSTRDVMSLVQELGVSASTANTSRTRLSPSSGGADGGPGGFPGGGMPPDITAGGGPGLDGGFAPGGSTGATPSASTIATMQARRADSGTQTATMVLLLIDPLITRLESIANQG